MHFNTCTKCSIKHPPLRVSFSIRNHIEDVGGAIGYDVIVITACCYGFH